MQVRFALVAAVFSMARAVGLALEATGDMPDDVAARVAALDDARAAKDYVAAEAEAKGKKIGLWQGQFMAPSEFRMKAGIFVERP